MYSTLDEVQFEVYIHILKSKRSISLQTCKVLLEICTEIPTLASDDVDRFGYTLAPKIKHVFVLPHISYFIKLIGETNNQEKNSLLRELLSLLLNSENKHLLQRYADWHTWLTPMLSESETDDMGSTFDFKEFEPDEVEVLQKPVPLQALNSAINRVMNQNKSRIKRESVKPLS